MFRLAAIVLLTLIVILPASLLRQGEAYGGSAGPPPGSGIIDVVTDDSGKNVYVLWAEYNESKQAYSTWLRASHDSGKTFEEVMDLSTVTNFPKRDLSAEMRIEIAASDPDGLFLAWTAQDPANPEVFNAYFVRSIDGGRNFGKPMMLDTVTASNKSTERQNVTKPASYSLQQLIASGHTVYAVLGYYDNNLGRHGGFSLRVSNDAGATFSDPVQVFGPPENISSWIQTAISPGGENLYVVASGADNVVDGISDGAVGILFKASRDGGKSFSGPVDLNQGSKAAIFAPKISASGKDRVYVAWSEMDENNKNIIYAYFRASRDGGRTFGEKIKIDSIPQNTSEIINSDFVDVVANKNADNVYVKWWDVHFSPDLTKEVHRLLIRASQDAGRTFNDPEELASGSIPPNVYDESNHQYVSTIGQDMIVTPKSSIANVTDNQVYVTWTADVGNYPEIFSTKLLLKGSTDGGKTFGISAMLPQDDKQAAAVYTKAAATGDNIYLAWDSGASGVHGLYFAASQDGGRSFGDVINLINQPEQQVMPEFGPITAFVMTAAIGGAMIAAKRFQTSRRKS